MFYIVQKAIFIWKHIEKNVGYSILIALINYKSSTIKHFNALSFKLYALEQNGNFTFLGMVSLCLGHTSGWKSE